MSQFPPIFAFLQDLRQNNNHEWFAAHRPEYDQAKALFEDFIQGLIFHFDVIEPLGDLSAKDAIFRIHNDMRFAKNRPPYKDHFSAVLAPGGRHSLRLPYYKHNHARRLASSGRRAHAHICGSARPFAWRSRRDSLVLAPPWLQTS
jgi:uncharacterized protein (TIGR02453 family)